jgi:Protein of unknown function (DUF3225)
MLVVSAQVTQLRLHIGSPQVLLVNRQREPEACAIDYGDCVGNCFETYQVACLTDTLLASSMGHKNWAEPYERDMQINIPEVLEELTAQFNEYERALLANEPDVLIGLFWCDPRTVRYGVAENLYGADEIAAYRKARAGQGGAPQRKTTRTVITTYGRDFGTTNIEYVRTESGKAGRQSQTWMRTPEGWRIVAAHVSLLVEDR